MNIWITNLKASDADRFCRETGWRDTITGEPQASEKYSSAALREMGMVGVYRTSDAVKEDSSRSGVALVDGKGHQALTGSGLQELRTGAGEL